MQPVHSVVGVDAGGTRSRAALARGDSILQRAEGPAGNPTLIGVADAADAMLQTIRDATRGERFEALYVGVAGAGNPAVAQELSALLSAAYPHAAVAVGDDVEIALRGAIPQGPGIALIAGTGSIALAVDERGARHRAGGLGYLLGDEGSAAWIGLEAVRLLARVYDGRARDEETSRLVARHLAAPDRPGLVRSVYGERIDVASIAALAPSIVAFAGKGNRASRAIVERASSELVSLVATVARASGLDSVPVRVALCGGLLRDDNFLVGLLQNGIATTLPAAEIVRDTDSLLGAVRCASGLLPR